MEISNRLKCIGNMVEKCNCIADIGTDHGYLPIYLLEKNICTRAIASDINRGPVEKAKKNIELSHLSDKIQCRLGPGLKTISQHEVDCAVIAGMGGNLIRDIIEESMDIFKNLNYVILQPVQNAEVLRKYVLESGYNIIDEELCVDDNKYYEVMKVKYDDENNMETEDIFFEISKKLYYKNHPLLKDFIFFKICKYDKILSSIVDNTMSAINRKKQLQVKIERLKELLKCL